VAKPEEESGGDREIAGGDDSYLLLSRPLVEVLVVGGRRPLDPTTTATRRSRAASTFSLTGAALV
jgi:hypothetical protein